MISRFGERNLMWLVLAIAICLVATTITVAEQEQAFKYVASRKGKRYHKPTCGSAKRIKPAHLIGFNSAQEALKAGYTPCKICKPPPQE